MKSLMHYTIPSIASFWHAFKLHGYRTVTCAA